MEKEKRAKTKMKYANYAHILFHKTKDKLLRHKMCYVTIKELFDYSWQWTEQIPKDFDAIVGIPRSGLLVATIIALKTGKPLATPQTFPKLWISKHIRDTNEIRKVLVVDDSIWTGQTLKAAIQQLPSNLEIKTGSLLVDGTSCKKVDYYFKKIPLERVYEWGLAHSTRLGNVVSDLDGVICENPPINLKAYEEWIVNAKPKFIPTFTLQAIITKREHKYMQATEAWLKRFNVKYKQIFYECDYHAKVEVVKHLKPNFVFESDQAYAKLIHQTTGLPVLCFDTNTLFS